MRSPAKTVVPWRSLSCATFRWSVPTYGAIRETLVPLIKLLPDAKRWYTITPQYVFGEALLEGAKNVLKEHGLEHVGNSYHSLQEQEFSGYLTNAIARSSPTLQRCSAELLHGESFAEAAE